MNQRLQQIIQYKTGGRQNAFAELMGWKTPYLNKLVKGLNFGLQPVLAILERFPDIDARWLLFGEGEMLATSKQAELRREAFNYVQEVLELEKYLCVMSPEELRQYEEAVMERRKPSFNPDIIAAWDEELTRREAQLNERITSAISKSDELCKHRTAKK